MILCLAAMWWNNSCVIGQTLRIYILSLIKYYMNRVVSLNFSVEFFFVGLFCFKHIVNCNKYEGHLKGVAYHLWCLLLMCHRVNCVFSGARCVQCVQPTIMTLLFFLSPFTLVLSWQGRLLVRKGEFDAAANVFEKILEIWYENCIKD